MPDYFRDYTPRELQQLGSALLEKSREKMPAHFRPDERMSEGYQYLSGEIQDKSQLYYGTYCNELYDVWKAWAPKFCSRPPNYLVRPGNRFDQPLANACQELFRYRVHRFDYQSMILQCCQDAVILGVGYGRHQIDKKRGLTTTNRLKPQSVFWDAEAKTISGAKHVVEKMTCCRGEFIERFGEEVGWDVPMSDNEEWPGYFPKESKWCKEGKSPLDPIEYYLLWSTHGGVRKMYAFHEEWGEDYLQPASRKANANVGEEWPFDFDEGEWHITPLVPTILNDRIEGIAMWEVVRGQYLAYQSLLGASIKFAMQVCKVGFAHPASLTPFMRQIEATGQTVFCVPYSQDDLQGFEGRTIDQLITKIDLGQVSPDLLREVQFHLDRFQRLAGANAVGQIQPGGVETAAEATKLADAAANRVADDQGAVERWTNKIGRKEQIADLANIPAMTVVKWSPRAEEDEDEGYGEEATEAPGAKYLRNVPYADAVLLEKGPASDKAALRMEALKEEARNQDFAAKMMGGSQEMQPTEEAVPVTPEVQVRRQYGVPVLADVEITSPGVEQFISAEAAKAWPQRAMTRREVEKLFQVSIEQGTASATGRMQGVQEILMIGKMVLPEYEKLGLDKQYAAYLNAIIQRAELWVLNDCMVSEEEIAAARQAMQQAQQQMMEAEAQAKNGQPQGPVPEDPNVMAKVQGELGKSQMGLETQREKTTQQRLKLEGDAVRERTRNAAQLQMGQMNPMNGVA